MIVEFLFCKGRILDVLIQTFLIILLHPHVTTPGIKDVMQGKLFQKCTHLLYCNVLSLGGNVNTRRMLQPDMGSIFQIKN